MATFRKYEAAKGARWTARVRLQGKQSAKTFATKTQAKKWADAQERVIESGEFESIAPGSGPIFADLVDAFRAHRRVVKKAPGRTFDNCLQRLKDKHGLELAAGMDAHFWRQHALARIASGVTSQTACVDLHYAGSVLSFAKRGGLIRDAEGPHEALRQLREEGLRVSSKRRERRLSEKELAALLKACDALDSAIPVGDIVRFALCTGLRKGEILALTWDDVDAARRVITVRDRKDPREPTTMEAPLMKKHKQWPQWDALAIINKQKRGSNAGVATSRIFPYNADSLGGRFEVACKDAKVDGFVFHGLRHQALSAYAQRGMDVVKLATISGHKTLHHLSRYVKLDASALANE